MKCLSSAALAASLALAVPAFAQQAPASDTAPPAAAPATTAPSTAGAPAAGAPSAAATGVDASATVGMPVADSTGAKIGQITAIDPDSTGKNMATVKMGAQSFQMDTTGLVVQGGTATINETKAQIVQQLPKQQ
jgi:3-oxoacyl-ACP reductase-like protein